MTCGRFTRSELVSSNLFQDYDEDFEDDDGDEEETASQKFSKMVSNSE